MCLDKEEFCIWTVKPAADFAEVENFAPIPQVLLCRCPAVKTLFSFTWLAAKNALAVLQVSCRLSPHGFCVICPLWPPKLTSRSRPPAYSFVLMSQASFPPSFSWILDVHTPPTAFVFKVMQNDFLWSGSWRMIFSDQGHAEWFFFKMRNDLGWIKILPE